MPSPTSLQMGDVVRLDRVFSRRRTRTSSLFAIFLILCSTCVRSNDDHWKITYHNDTEDLNSRWIADKYRDKLVLEQLKIIIESEKASVVHYVLPMDAFQGRAIVNPSGLEAVVSGNPVRVAGILGNAIQVNGRDNFVRVAGSKYRSECFGDLDRCPIGYTLSFWVKFDEPIANSEHVFISNGGHHLRSHGVAVLYHRGKMEFRFKKKNGQEWRAKSNDILPGRWYHVAGTWGPHQGLTVYVNGELVDTSSTPVTRGSPLSGNTTEFNDFFIGRPNDNSQFSERRTVNIDELNFWSEFKKPEEIRELGPMYRYYLPMDANPGLNVEDGNIKVAVGGNPSRALGKMSGALEFDGREDFITGEDQSTTCLGDLALCRYGLTVGAWIRFDELHDSYVLSTGNKGVKLYLRDGRLVAEAQQGDRRWTTYWPAPPELGRWYFVETTWNPRDGLGLFADLKEVARSTSYSSGEPASASSLLQIGKSGQNLRNERYAAMVMDELEMWYGSRNQLVDLDFIARGRPIVQQLSMDAVSYNRIPHPNITVETFGQPKIVDGKISGALYLDGNSQYVSLGNQHGSCLGNLDHCPHGLLLSSWIRPGNLREGMDLLSSGTNGLRAWFSGGQLHVSARTTTKEWTLRTDKLTPDKWQFIEFGWDPRDGLAVYVDDQLVARGTDPVVRSASDNPSVHPDDEKFYIGRGDGSRSNAHYANVTIDDLDYWFNNRKYLLAFEYIQRGKKDKFYLDMDSIRDNKLVHPSLNIPVYGNPAVVAGKVNGAIRFNGSRQYLDAGDHSKSCLGNMDHCTNGLTGSMWINFRSLHDSTYYLSSGGGLRVYYSDGKLWVVVNRSGVKWEVGIPDMNVDRWYFLEYTWHPEKGLQVYVDNRLVGESKRGTSAPSSAPSGKYLIGGANSADGRFRYADAAIDEVETWFMDRESLIAFNDLVRGNISHVVFPLESHSGSRIQHPDYVIIMYNGAVLVPGKVGYGIDLGGNGEYVTFGDQRHSCLGNLEMCHRGLTISMYLNPRTLPNNGYILSSGPYSIYSKDGKVYVKFTSGKKSWEVETNRIRLNDWQKVEVSWDEKKGLHLYVNKEKVASTTEYTVLPSPPRVNDYSVYLGRPNEDTRDGTYANAKIDELEYWFANRDLIEFDDDVRNLIVDMNQIAGDIVIHPSRVVRLIGGARIITGTYGTGILLDGRNQYMDVGGKEVFCGGDLENCQKGFTLRFKIAPRRLVENTYFVSSAPVDVYYQNNRLVAEVRTPRYVWRTSTGELERNAWHQVDLSWHPIDGLVMFVNSQQVDQQTAASNNYADYVIDKRFYIGRANTEMRSEYYADAIFDDLQIWEAKRDYLISMRLIKPNEDDVSGWTTARPRPTVASTRIPRPEVTIPSNLPGHRRRLLFNGFSWVAYDFGQLPRDYLRQSDHERLTIKFQSDRPDGLLWYNGDDNNNSHLTLKDGYLFLVSRRDGGRDIKRVRIASSRLDDNAWHDVVLTKRDGQIFIEIDRKEYPPLIINNDFSFVRPGNVYLGGSGNTNDITDSHISSNFYGRIREATIYGNSLPGNLDLKGLYLLQPGHILVRPRGEIINEEDEDQTPKPKPQGKQPITFVTKHSHLRLPTWNAVQSGTLEFHFRTVEPTGLILFSGYQSQNDFIAVEIYDAILYLVVNLGNKVNRFPFNSAFRLIDDGQPHSVRIERNGRDLRLALDGEERSHTIESSDPNLEPGAIFFAGGVDHKERLPWHVWTGDAAGIALGEDRKYFRGCLWDLRMNGQEPIDLESYVEQQQVTGIEPGCRDMPVDCETTPCHIGTCTERWNGFFCDCSETSFTGKRCELKAPFVPFTGHQYLRVNIQPTYKSHTNDISLRFRTLKDSGLLFSTSNRAADDYLNAFLENGQVKLETNLGGGTRPVRLIVQCRTPLNDDRWHTLHVRRRAHYLEAHVDNCAKSTEELPGEGYGLSIDDILVGKMGHDDSSKNSFVGYLQNFYFDRYKFFDYFLYGGQPADIRFGGDVNATLIEIPLPIHSITFRQSINAYLVLPALQILGDTSIKLMFRTNERDGLLMYNGGHGGDFFAMALVNGVLHVSANDGGGARVVTSSAPFLSDNNWHLVEIVQTEPKKFTVTVDNKYESMLLLLESRNTLDLADALYIGGIPESIRHQLPSIIASHKSFAGCLASLYINRRLYNLMTDVTSPSPYVIPGCSDVSGFCSPGICGRRGVCLEAVDGFFCDCNMTSFVGRFCGEEAEGYYFGDQFRPGISVFRFNRMDTSSDRIALGFMTWNPNGTLVRLDSDTSADFIEARLVNGHVVVMYDLGDGIRYLNETRHIFNDGRYHYLVFTRSGDNATLQIDDFPFIYRLAGATGSVRFNGLIQATIGGNLDLNNEIIDYFNGIISGVYINGNRIVDLDVYHGDKRVVRRGDIYIATHPFRVPYSEWPRITLKPPVITTTPPVIPPVITTSQPVIPPVITTTQSEIIVPPLVPTPGPPGGGGMGWIDGGGGGDGVVIIGNPEDPLAEAVVGSPPVSGAGVEDGARAAAVAGAMIGVLAAVSSAVWAFYKFKPGLIGGGAGASRMVISNPTSANIPLLPAGGGGGAGGGAPGGAMATTGPGSGAGAGGAAGAGAVTADGFAIKGGALSGSGGGAGAGAGAGSASYVDSGMAGGRAGAVNLSEHFQSISSSSVTANAVGGGGAGGGGAGIGGGSGTMNRGIQTESALVAGGGGGGAAAAQDQTISRSTYIQQDIRNIYNVNQDAAYGSGQGVAQGMGTLQGQGQGGYASGYGSSGQTLQQGLSSMSSSSYAYDGSQGYAQGDRVDSGGYRGISPQGLGYGEQSGLASTAGNMYEMQNMTLGYSGISQQELLNQQRMAHQRLVAASGGAGGAPVPNLMAAEEIRVDCAKMTTNGRYVVTGSIFGPPQVWDLKTGDLVRIMKGEDFSSTDLHLANGDTLLVGQVAELEQVNPTDPAAIHRLHHRKLQIWDFESGHPLDMRRNELCTASCMMNDGERMLLGRTDKYGKNTVIIIWDILGNEQLRQITCDASVGFADYISYLNLSKDNRYVIAGFQNSHDHKANFITFDLSSSSTSAASPKIMALDANAEVTAILENHEAVTGTRGGELIIWSVRTGRELRQLVSPSPGGTLGRRDAHPLPAHNQEVKDVVVSKDGQLLVSASADRTLRMWNMELEKLMHTLIGHTDEVWCCTISNDNELVVSGSRDCTIRLWRTEDGQQTAAIDAGMDVFRVLLSNNKKTIVALADKAASRKLIMLKVVRSRIKGSSRAASPRWHDGLDVF